MTDPVFGKMAVMGGERPGNEMVERVALALCRQSLIYEPGDRSNEIAANWQYFIDDARAAVAALREPTEAMLDAVRGSESYTGLDYIEAWRKMIDEALR